MTISSHLKALLYKETLLLKRDTKRIFVEFVLTLVLVAMMCFSLGTISKIDVKESSKLDEGYGASSELNTLFSKHFKQLDYGKCQDFHSYLGLVSNSATFTEILKQKLSENANINVMEFPTVEALKKYAENPTIKNAKDNSRDIICLGVSLLNTGNKYSYTLHVDKNEGTLNRESIYDDGVAYAFSYNNKIEHQIHSHFQNSNISALSRPSSTP